MKLTKEAIMELGIKPEIPHGKKKELAYTTFRLSPNTHTTIRDLAKERNLTLTEVFDTLVSYAGDIVEGLRKQLPDLFQQNITNGTRKTYALTRETATKINKCAKENKITRDSLIETAVTCLKAFSDFEVERSRKKYPQILKDYIEPLYSKAEEIESIVEKELGIDDPVRKRLGLAIVHLMNLTMEMEQNIKDGTPIEPWD